MEREHRHLDRESNKESKEKPNRILEWNLRSGLVERREAEAVNAGESVVMEIQKQNRQQHQHRTRQSVEEKFDGGVEFARASPNADQQIHRHQHRFPEDE